MMKLSLVFVVDDDVSVRESLEPLIRCEGWRAETFASAQEFLSRPRVSGLAAGRNAARRDRPRDGAHAVRNDD